MVRFVPSVGASLLGKRYITSRPDASDFFGQSVPSQCMRTWHIRLRSALKDAGHTFEDVAAHIGVSRSAVGHYLRGTREPSVAQIKKMCELAGKSISEIVGDDALFVQQPDERKMIEDFRSMSPDQQRAILLMVQQMAKRD